MGPVRWTLHLVLLPRDRPDDQGPLKCSQICQGGVVHPTPVVTADYKYRCTMHANGCGMVDPWSLRVTIITHMRFVMHGPQHSGTGLYTLPPHAKHQPKPHNQSNTSKGRPDDRPVYISVREQPSQKSLARQTNLDRNLMLPYHS
jgi:hypothetical protein